MGMLQEITTPYSTLEAWSYDRFVAPASTAVMVEQLRGELGQFLQVLPPSPRILDVGCGGGQNALALAELIPGSEITGLDLSADQIRRARRRASAARSRVTFTEGSALRLPFADASFDLVVSVGSIKHWPDPQRGLAECVRVLRPGGTLIIVEVDRGGSPEDIRAFVQRFRVPAPLRGLVRRFFCRFVAGRAPDLQHASTLLEGLPLVEAEVRSLTGLPCWLLRGQKSAAVRPD